MKFFALSTENIRAALVEETRDFAEYGLDFFPEGNDFGRKHAEGVRDDGEVDAGIRHDGFAIQVHPARLLADDGKRGGFHRLDFTILIDLFGKQLDRELGDVFREERRKDRDVHLPVLDIRMRRDVGIIAILRSIAARHEESLLLNSFAIGQQVVHLRLVAQVFLDGILYISKRTAPLLARELLAYRRIEADSARTKEHMFVCPATIDAQFMPTFNDFKRAPHVHRDMKFAC